MVFDEWWERYALKEMRLRPEMVRFETGEAMSWRIGYGVSRFLIAEGSGWSRPAGWMLLHRLRWPQGARARFSKPRKGAYRP